MTDAEFWLDRWAEGRTGWQEAGPGALFVRHFAALGLAKGARVFVPLCGASPDIGWLLAQGFRVAAAELSGLAIGRLFDGLKVTAAVSDAGRMRRHSAPGIDVFEGDIFDLTPDLLGPVDAIHDRAALFALAPSVRPAYAAHLIGLTGGAPQLLNCLDYEGDPEDGPPFSVPPEEVARLYGSAYRITLLEEEGAEIFRTGQGARDSLWLLARGEEAA